MSSSKNQICITALLLVAVFFLFELTNIDFVVQSYFYDDFTHKWILSHQDGNLLDFLFYSGIKKVIFVFGISILFLYLYSFKESATTLREYRKGLLVVWLSIAIVPAVIGFLKSVSNVPCPCDFRGFGGDYPYIRVLDVMPQEIIKKFKCYPAGHASGGFALMSLFFLFKTDKNRITALIIAIGIGWNMGIYKILVGHHYLSHTLVTMILSWLMILVIYKSIK
ncbi:MAG: phosphatase PAP2 family protein [Campylobacterota bacterium]